MLGEENGHSLDLMALDSNAIRDKQGRTLPHFIPYPTSVSAGVNVFSQDLRGCDGIKTNLYVFPPFGLIFALLCFLLNQDAVATMIVPRPSLLPPWWPI